MTKKFISFLSPVFNVNSYLDDFLSSFSDIPRDSYEIVIVNDKSVEDPSKIIDKWKGLLNIKYIENAKNMGIGFSRNVALSNISTKSTHFMFVDSDDKLSKSAWNQILNAEDGYVYVSSKYILFDKKGSVERSTWQNKAFVGSGVLSAWGNLVPVEKAIIKFTSETFEDFRWMAQITRDMKFKFFNDPIIEYRNRASSIMNTPYNTKKRAKYIVDHAFELKKAWNDELISDEKILVKDLKNLYINFYYISSKNRQNLKFDSRDLDKKNLIEAKVVTSIQKTIRFWWWVELFTKRKAFK